MSIDPNVNDLLQGGGKSYSWKNQPLGTVHRLTVTSAKKVQQSDFDTGAPKFWDNGDPMWQLAITGETDERDADDPNDDGTRVEYVSGQKLQALREALRKANAGSIAVGGKLAIKHVENKPTKGNDQKIYAVQYTAPPEPAFKPDEEPF